MWNLLKKLLRLWILLMGSFGAMRRKVRARAPRKWRINVTTQQTARVDKADIERLIQRHRDLGDSEKLAKAAASFRLPESDFFADPRHIETLLRRLLEASPPWLRVSKKLAGGESGGDAQAPEFLMREQVVREWQDVDLLIPDEAWSDRPLASLTMRPARNLEDVWKARMLDQVLPPEVLIDRMNRGEVLLPVRHGAKQRLEFRSVTRRMEITVRRPVPIPIEREGGAGRGGQLLYILLDYSASMQGKNAVLALAVIAALVRANLGKGETRYLFRRYALDAEIWPPAATPPAQARILKEKDALLDVIFATNFNGGATHVNDALQIAISDVENLRKTEHLEAEILLVTDGRAEMLEGMALRLRQSKVKLHTVMVTAEPNPSLAAISESFTALDIPLGAAREQRTGNGERVGDWNREPEMPSSSTTGD